jgi:hypothetical protein
VFVEHPEMNVFRRHILSIHVVLEESHVLTASPKVLL